MNYRLPKTALTVLRGLIVISALVLFLPRFAECQKNFGEGDKVYVMAFRYNPTDGLLNDKEVLQKFADCFTAKVSPAGLSKEKANQFSDTPDLVTHKFGRGVERCELSLVDLQGRAIERQATILHSINNMPDSIRKELVNSAITQIKSDLKDEILRELSPSPIANAPSEQGSPRWLAYSLFPLGLILGALCAYGLARSRR